MLELTLKELRISGKSLTYWLLVILLAAFLFSQIGTSLEAVTKPTPNQDSYGLTTTTDSEIIQQETYKRLLQEYTQNSYSTYPFGFYKLVVLSENQQKTVAAVLTEVSGLSLSELQAKYEESIEAMNLSEEQKEAYVFPLKAGHTYKHFEKQMSEISSLIGSGSSYEQSYYETNTRTERTYEQALAQYQEIVQQDKVSGAYARNICDYLGIILAILPVFLAATVTVRDKRSRSTAVIYVRDRSSATIVLARYLSTIVLMILPVVILSLMPALQSIFIANQLGASSSLLLFFQYILGWTLPTIVCVVGVGSFITELAGGITAVIFQLLWWLLDIVSNGSSLVGGIGWHLIPRFNTVGSREIFDTVKTTLILNRIGYLALGFGCILLTIVVYHRKRTGRWLYGRS